MPEELHPTPVSPRRSARPVDHERRRCPRHSPADHGPHRNAGVRSFTPAQVGKLTPVLTGRIAYSCPDSIQKWIVRRLIAKRIDSSVFVRPGPGSVPAASSCLRRPLHRSIHVASPPSWSRAASSACDHCAILPRPRMCDSRLPPTSCGNHIPRPRNTQFYLFGERQLTICTDSRSSRSAGEFIPG